MRATKRPQMTEKDWKTIVELNRLGVKTKVIHDITDRGQSTIDRVLTSKSFEDYKEKTRLIHTKQVERAAVARAAKTVSPLFKEHDANILLEMATLEQTQLPVDLSVFQEQLHAVAKIQNDMAKLLLNMIDIIDGKDGIKSTMTFIAENMLIDPDQNHVALKNHQADEARTAAAPVKKRFWG